MNQTAKDFTDLDCLMIAEATDQERETLIRQAREEMWQMILSGPPEIHRQTLSDAYELGWSVLMNLPEEPEVSEDDFLGEVKQTFGCPTCGED